MVTSWVCGRGVEGEGMTSSCMGQRSSRVGPGKGRLSPSKGAPYTAAGWASQSSAVSGTAGDQDVQRPWHVLKYLLK